MKSNPTGGRTRTQSKQMNVTAILQRFTSTRAGLLQRKCACGSTPRLTGECAECRGKRLQPGAAERSETPSAPHIAHDALRAPGRPLDQATHRLANPGSGHDFNDVRVHAALPEATQTKSILPTDPGASAEISIPASGEEDQIFDAPNTFPAINDINGGGSSGGGGQAASSCDEPLTMNKVISGAFQGGVQMDDYYPDLVGSGAWQHSGTGGPFDTGTRVGSNAQLYGTIPSPCRPELFSLSQTVQYTRAIIDGVHHPREGVVQDDLAKSSRDFSVPPFRLAWLGGGYNISMADPPSIGYGPSSNIEFDRAFVTSLVGPGGRKSVNWSTSIRVVNGSVTRNMIS